MATRKKSPPLSKSAPLVEGRLPAPLPVDPEALLDALRAAEALALDAKTMFEANQRRLALVKQTWPAGAARRLIDRIGFDVGEYPENLDSSKAKSRPQMKKLDEAFLALTTAGIAREETLKTLFAIASADVAFQEEWLPKLDALPRRLARRLFTALAGSSKLAPVVLERLRRDVRTRDPELVATAAWALFQQGPEVAHAELAPLISAADLQLIPELEYAKAILDAGAATPWSPAWQPILEKLVPLKDVPYDFNRLNHWRAETQLGTTAARALGEKKAVVPAAKVEEKKKAAVPSAQRAPIDGKKLESAAARERALDTLADWVVERLSTADDDAVALDIMRAGVTAFYDIREAGDQERGEYAGHFFMVDAVGLADSDRAVPWERLRAKVSSTRMTRLTELFDQAERESS